LVGLPELLPGLSRCFPKVNPAFSAEKLCKFNKAPSKSSRAGAVAGAATAGVGADIASGERLSVGAGVPPELETSDLKNVSRDPDML
jgi:hypothetical protein